MKKILLFAGTTEGRLMAEMLSKNKIKTICCVATEYGKNIMPELGFVTVREGRMDESEIEAFIISEQVTDVIDATHPYADIVSANVKQACENTGISYTRLLRESLESEIGDGCKVFKSNEEAAAYLNGTKGNILLTTGLKELPFYCENIRDTDRIYARVLPNADIKELLDKYGLKNEQIICRQGPFSREANELMINELKARYLVTKESGKAGGFMEKVEAAANCGAECLVITRPVQYDGMSFEAVCEKFGLID